MSTAEWFCILFDMWIVVCAVLNWHIGEQAQGMNGQNILSRWADCAPHNMHIFWVLLLRDFFPIQDWLSANMVTVKFPVLTVWQYCIDKDHFNVQPSSQLILSWYKKKKSLYICYVLYDKFDLFVLKLHWETMFI